MKIENRKIIFNDGAERYCSYGIIGLSPEFDIHDGYDGTLYNKELCELDRELIEELDWKNFENNVEDSEYCMSIEHRLEIAEYMIDKWNKFKRMCNNDK